MQPEQTGTSRNDKLAVDMRNVLSLLRKKWLWLFLPPLFVCLISVIYVLSTPSFYESQARITVAEESTTVDDVLESLASQLNKGGVVNKVIADLGIQRRAEFDPLTKGGGLSQSFLIGVGLVKDPRLVPKAERVLSTFLERLTVTKSLVSRSVIVRFKAQDPKLAASIANMLVEEAIKAVTRGSSGLEGSESLAFSARLAEVEAQIEALKKANTLQESQKNGSGTNGQAAANAQILKLQTRANFIREAVRLGRIIEVNEIANQDAVKRLFEQRKQIKSQIAFDERTLPPSNQKMKDLFSQLNAIDSQLRVSAEKAARAYEDEARTLANSRGITLPFEGGAQGMESAGHNGQLARLEQEAHQLREKINKARNEDVANDASSDVKIAQKATPSYSKQHLQKIITIFYNTFVAFVLSLIGVAFVELFFKQHKHKISTSSLTALNPQGDKADEADAFSDPVVSSFDWAQNASHPSYNSGIKSQLKPAPEAINQNTPGTVLPGQGTPLPQPEASSPLAALPASLTELTQAYAHLHKGTSNTRSSFQKDKSFVEDISCELQCMGYLGRGKVTIIHALEIQARSNLHSVRLGRRLSKEGATITIELFKKDSLYSQLTGQNLAGLGNYLEGEATLADIIHRDAKSKLHVIPLGGYEGLQTCAAKHKDKLEFIINLLMQSYSHIVLDAGPVGSDGEVLTSVADAIIIVTQSETTSLTLTRTLERFETLSAKPIFVVHDEFMDNPAEQAAASPRIIGVVRQ